MLKISFQYAGRLHILILTVSGQGLKIVSFNFKHVLLIRKKKIKEGKMFYLTFLSVLVRMLLLWYGNRELQQRELGSIALF